MFPTKVYHALLIVIDAPYEPFGAVQDRPLEAVMEQVQAVVWKKLDKMTLARVIKGRH